MQARAPQLVTLAVGALASCLFPTDAVHGQERERTPAREARTAASTPLSDATARREKGQRAGDVAVFLQREHRLSPGRVAATLSRAGYPAEEVSAALVRDLRLPADRAAVALERAGVDAADVIRGFQGSRIGGPVAMRAVKVGYGLEALIASLQADRKLCEGAPDSLRDAGLDLSEIATVLRDGCGWSVQEILEWMVEEGEEPEAVGTVLAEDLDTAPGEAAALLARLGVGVVVAVAIVLAAAVTGAVGALVTAAVVAAGALIGAGYSVSEVGPALAENGLTPEEAVEVLAAADQGGATGAALAAAAMNLTLAGTAEELVDAGHAWPVIAAALREAFGASDSEIVNALLDAGASSEEVAAALRDGLGLGVSGAASAFRNTGRAWDWIASVLVDVYGEPEWDEASWTEFLTSLRDAGAPLEDLVRWAWENGKLTVEEIVERLKELRATTQEIRELLITVIEMQTEHVEILVGKEP